MSPLLARIVWSILAGIIAFIIVFVIGAVLISSGVAFGSLVERFAPLIGLLVGLGYFLSGNTLNRHV